ncbi:MAG: PD40 domain-containing protein [Bacteroidetes bacterium]|nr:PD40 domain-containing protein [Bacteroidota bacterium]
MISGPTYRVFIFFLLLSGVVFSQTNTASETDLKKKADRFYNAQDYEPALPLYSQLLSLYPKDAVYNYRYGVCLISAGKDKVNSISYLEFASTQATVDPDVWYYLGKGYMLAGNFQNAKKVFEQFKTLAPSAKVKKLETDLLISNCSNAEELMKSRRNVAVMDVREVSRTNFYSLYDFSDANGKLLPTADKFLTGSDKDLQVNPTMFMTKDGQNIYYSSYGKNTIGGKDLYLRRKMTNGEWGEPENLGTSVNTTENEDFPVLDRDGRTLYFSSRGHTSIGGYDLYKTQFDFNTGKWSSPENLGIPINTVDDDLLYLSSLKGDHAIYATATDAGKGKIQLRNIQLGDISNNLVSISGTYFSLDQVTRRDARVTVLRTSDHGIITSVRTDRTGKYELVLEPGQEYTLVVEGGSYLPHAENFSIPMMAAASLRQEVKLIKTKEKEEMTLVNFFTPLTAGTTAGTLAVSDVPTETISNAYEISGTDTSGMIPVKIDNQVVYVAAPSAATKQTAVNDEQSSPQLNQQESKNSSDNTDTSVPGELTADQIRDLEDDTIQDLTGSSKVKKERYDPFLEKSMTPDEIKQKSEEDSRTKEVVLEEKGKAEEIDVNVSNADLAKLAFDDARAIDEEATSLKQEAAALRMKAVAKDSISAVLLHESEKEKVKDPEKSTLLLTQSEESHTEAEQLVQQASLLEEQSSQRTAEAKLALEDAQKLVVASQENNTLANSSASKNRKPTSGTTKEQNKQTDAQQKDKEQSENSIPKQSELSSNQQVPEENKVVQTNTDLNTEKSAVENVKTTSTVLPEQNKASQNQGVKNPETKTAENSKPVANPETNDPVLAVNKTHENTSRDQSIQGTEPVTELKQKEKTSTQNPIEISESKSSGKENSESLVADPKTKQANTIQPKLESKDSNQIVEKEKGSPQDKTNAESIPTNVQSAQDPAGKDKTNVSGSTTEPSVPLITSNEKLDSNSESKTTEVQSKNSDSGKQNEQNNNQEQATIQQDKSGNSISQVETEAKKEQSLSETTKNKATDQSNVQKRENVGRQNAASPVNVNPNSTKNESVIAAGNQEKINDTNQDVGLKTSNTPVQVKRDVATLSQQDVSSIPNVKTEALVAYKGYEDRITLSRKLALQSENLQERVAGMKVSPVRDSLIEVSNSISHESITTWQAAQSQLKAAKQIDPEIEEKVTEYKNTQPQFASAVNPSLNNTSGTKAVEKDSQQNTLPSVVANENKTSDLAVNSNSKSAQNAVSNPNSSPANVPASENAKEKGSEILSADKPQNENSGAKNSASESDSQNTNNQISTTGQKDNAVSTQNKSGNSENLASEKSGSAECC